MELGYVYLMKESSCNFYKIGRSQNVKQREATLQAEKPSIMLIGKRLFHYQDSLIVEKELQKRYRPFKKRGEWFELSEVEVNEILEYFNSKDMYMPTVQEKLRILSAQQNELEKSLSEKHKTLLDEKENLIKTIQEKDEMIKKTILKIEDIRAWYLHKNPIFRIELSFALICFTLFVSYIPIGYKTIFFYPSTWVIVLYLTLSILYYVTINHRFKFLVSLLTHSALFYLCVKYLQSINN